MRSFFCGLGDFVFFSLSVVRKAFGGRYSFRSCVEQMHRIGVESLSVVNLCTLFIGLVLVLQTAAQLTRFGAKAEVSSIVWSSFILEIGPVFAAIMFAGRSGTGIAAEIGSMVVTEQIDAYVVFGSDPTAKLAVPRVLATAVMLPALTVVASVVGIFGGLLLAKFHLGVDGSMYLKKGIEAVTRLDIVACLAKGFSFGLLVGLLATWFGFRTERTADAVGAAATKTMVAGVLAILIVDLALTRTFLLIQYG